jgi:dolichyl-phosphate-mannose--protein O-mannosyl transferase
MRSVPALTGSLLIPLVYMIMLQLNYSQWTAALAGFLFLFGKKHPLSINQTDNPRIIAKSLPVV